MKVEAFTKYADLPELIKGSLLHSKEMFHLLEQHTNAQPIMIVAFDNKKEAGHIIAVKYRELRIIPPGYYTWYTIHGEGTYLPECKNKEEIFKLLIEKLFTLFDFNHTFIDIRNLKDARFAYNILSKKNFFPRRDRRIYISLHSKEPEKRLTRTYRANIRKAEQRGVTHKQISEHKEIETAIKILRRYYASKLRNHLPPTEFLLHLLTNSNNEETTARMFAIYHKEKIIGCSLCIYDKDRAYLAYSCGLRKSHPLLYPGIMAVWVAIKDAYKRGFQHFEFLEPQGTSIPSGYLNFLLNFGGKQVSTLRWRHFKWNIINKILKAIYV